MRGLLLLPLIAGGCVRDAEPSSRPNQLVSVATETGGTVVSTPAGISCGAVCTGSFARGTVVTLEPRPDPGAVFAGWSGACSGKRLCVLSVAADVEVAARFRLADGTPVPVELARKPDLDHDGIDDKVDRCPVEAEDRDDFEDADGCPEEQDPPPVLVDVDADGDGLPGASDACPDEPEDMDGFDDGDGCPDPDNDSDGVLDVDDLCPNDPENRNGYQDADGCPERKRP